MDRVSARTLVVRPEYVIDGTDDQLRTGCELVVDGGRISAVRAVGESLQAHADLLELPGATVLPGLIDCHVHYTIDPRLELADGIAQGARDPGERCVLVGARNARLALASGVTTARSAGASRDLDIALASAIERGDVPGPRLVPAGRAITITGGHGRHFGIEVDDRGDMVRAVRTLVRDGAGVIKVVASEAAMLTSDLAGVAELTAEEMTAVVAEAGRLRRRVLAHAQSSEAVIAAAHAGVASVEHAFLADEQALRCLKDSGAFLTPTLTVTDVYAHLAGLPPEVRTRQRFLSAQHRASCQTAIELGIPLVAGTDCGVRGVFPDMLSREIALLHAHGLPPMAAMRAATANAAELLGLSGDVGTLEPGKRADLLAVAGNPIEDLAALRSPLAVIKDGRVVSKDGALRL